MGTAGSSSCGSLRTNPDIGGIGVRHSFYIQSWCLLGLLFLNSGRRALAALQILLWTSFGLAVAAVVQAALGELTFLEALQATNLIWLTNFSSFLVILYYFRKNKSLVSRNYAIQISAIAHISISMVLTLIMWTNPAQFSAQRECVHDVQYAIFTVRVPAEGSVRIACLAVTSCLTLAYFVYAFYELRSFYRLYRRESKPKIPFDKELPSTSSFDVSKHAEMERQPEYPLGESHRRRRKFDPFMAAIAFSYATATGYFMGSTDAMVFDNPAVDHESLQWGFGQILAMVVVIPTVISVCIEFVIELRRRARRRRQAATFGPTWERHPAGPVVGQAI